jgi:hypothetical protein
VPVLQVTEDGQWLEVFGVLPQPEDVSGDEYVRKVRIPACGGEELHVTWDTTDASVRIHYERSGGVLLDLYRESATRVLVEKSAGFTALVVEYRSADTPYVARRTEDPTAAPDPSQYAWLTGGVSRRRPASRTYT